MAAWGTRQVYPAVVGTVLVLTVVFTATAVIRPLIPQPDPNPVVNSPGAFMASAAKQRVKWRTLDDRPFLEARRADKALVLVVGCAWNWGGREFDKNVLESSEVAERLNREFVPVRIDADEDPEWLAGPFPLAAASQGVDPGWYVLVLRPDGRPLAWMVTKDWRTKFELGAFESVLTKAHRAMGEPDDKSTAVLAEQLLKERGELTGGSSDTGDLAVYARRLQEAMSAPGVLAENGLQGLNTWEWRFLLAVGATTTAQEGVERTIEGPLPDWIDGGFFRTAVLAPSLETKFEKIAIENADAACLLAHLVAVTSDPSLRWMAERSFEAILDEFVSKGQVIAFTYRGSSALGRNGMNTFSPGVLASSFSPVEREHLARGLSLDPSTNPQMSPRVGDLGDMFSHLAEYQQEIERLRRLRKASPATIGPGDVADSTCHVVARLLESRRLLGGTKGLPEIRPLLDRVSEFRSGPDGVVRQLEGGRLGAPYLGDYLAYADACLQVYLTLGDSSWLDQGRAVLQRALQLFLSGKPSVLSALPKERLQASAQWTGLPEVTDLPRGSLTADAVRLSQMYSCLLRDRREGQALRQFALNGVAQYAPLTKAATRRIGSLAHAMAVTLADDYVVVTGPGALEASGELATIAPETLVFPAGKVVRADLEAKGAGAWIVRHGQVTGPMTVEQARSALTRSP
ncbi:MAG: DUF255 domain-containing protein [Armatimonadetes bacterium]|nr:DUF255 domain-containing protein [Armatimonadota bacterium]